MRRRTNPPICAARRGREHRSIDHPSPATIGFLPTDRYREWSERSNCLATKSSPNRIFQIGATDCEMCLSAIVSYVVFAVDARVSACVRLIEPSSVFGFNADSRDYLRHLFAGGVPRNLEWTDQARGTARASIVFPQRLRRLLSP